MVLHLYDLIVGSAEIALAMYLFQNALPGAVQKHSAMVAIEIWLFGTAMAMFGIGRLESAYNPAVTSEFYDMAHLCLVGVASLFAYLLRRRGFNGQWGAPLQDDAR